jgi:hypothetical protein
MRGFSNYVETFFKAKLWRKFLLKLPPYTLAYI